MRPGLNCFCKALALLSFLLAASSALAKIIVVNTTNNVSPGPGETNLVMAINALADGDAVHFNIPGTGPFYLATPPLVPDNGYPAITNNNVTIDGYTQPGSSPNSNTILSSNNANIEIVLDSRDGGAHMEDIPGYGTTEAAVLFIKGATNVTVNGLCFLGPGTGSNTDGDPYRYAISFALEANYGHVHGCWFGVDIDRTNVYRFRDAVTGFEGPTGHYINGTVIGVEKTAADAFVARAEFNIIVGEFIPIILEGENHRISGNFLNVFPDGLTDYNMNGAPPFDTDAVIEIGRRGNNLVLGTDGDGANDAEERNIFGGVTAAHEGEILQWYGGSAPQTNMVIAGNYIGVAVDGTTRFTNSIRVYGGLNATATARIGSDFDGVSDPLEGNFIAMNYPSPSPGSPVPPLFGSATAGARVSLRGNRLVGNNTPPFSFATGTGNRLAGFTNYYRFFLQTNLIIPTLSAASTQARLRGSCDLGKAPYTNIIFDVYLADEEGWTNGQSFQLVELAYMDAEGNTLYHGFAQGRIYLGSFTDNGPQDMDPAPGRFDFDIHSFNIPVNALVTVSASYSADTPGTPNGRAHTSPCAMPITLLPAARLNISKFANNLIISWPTNSGGLTLQSTTTIVPADWVDVGTQGTPIGTNYEVSLPISSTNVFFRLKN